jgi:hypothetical protein
VLRRKRDTANRHSQPAGTERGHGSEHEVHDVVITRVPSWSTREDDEMSEKAISNLRDRLDQFRKAFESGAPP